MTPYMIETLLSVWGCVVRLCFAVLVVPQVHLVDDLLLSNRAFSAQCPVDRKLLIWVTKEKMDQN
jgi:hypothetical protein